MIRSARKYVSMLHSAFERGVGVNDIKQPINRLHKILDSPPRPTPRPPRILTYRLHNLGARVTQMYTALNYHDIWGSSPTLTLVLIESIRSRELDFWGSSRNNELLEECLQPAEWYVVRSLWVQGCPNFCVFTVCPPCRWMAASLATLL